MGGTLPIGHSCAVGRNESDRCLVTVRDLESGQLMQLDAFHAKTRKAFEARQANAYGNIREAFKAADLDCIEISTAKAAADALTRYFRYRERKKSR